jgi:hypothetical protein
MIHVIQKAISTCKRNIVGRQKGGVLTRLVKVTGRKCSISIDHSVPTACWSFDGNHIIKVGTSLDTICNTSTRYDDSKLKKFVEAVIRHETEHGILTDRTNETSERCKAEGVPFALYNLFEDVRIEFDSATRVDGDGAFRWTNYQDVEASYNAASALLWAIKTNEAGIKKQPSAYVPKWDGADSIQYKGKSKKTRLVVLDFYRRACNAPCSIDLVAICKEWIELFGMETPPLHTDNVINGVSDNRDPNGVPIIAPTGEPKQCDSKDVDIASWSQKSSAINTNQVQRIARNLRNVVQSASIRKDRLSCNGTRLNASAAMCGSDRAFQARRKANGKRSVTMLVDMSGSMNSSWTIHGGREFVLAFRELAKRNMIDLKLVLTVAFNKKPRNYVIKSTDSDQWINNLKPFGNGDGIMGTMKRHLPMIKASQTTVIYTDSELRDNDIDTGVYRKMGINAIASYIEPCKGLISSGRDRMDRHFGRSVIANNANELAQRLMREILKD